MIQANGRVSGGVIALPYEDDLAVRTHFEQRGMTVIFIRRLSAVLGALYAVWKSVTQTQIKKELLVEFLRNVAIMLASGIPVSSAVKDSVSAQESRALAVIIEDIQMSFQAGLSFSEAIERHPDVFPETVRYLVRIGEETGTLDRTLKDAADHLSRMKKISGDAKKVMIYPSFVLAATLVATIYWLYYVVPNVLSLFVSMQVKLPAITVMLKNVSDFMLVYIVHVIVGIAATLGLCVLTVKKNQKIRYQFHFLLLRMPVSRVLVSSSNLAFITEYFSLLVGAGVSILTSLEILAGSVKHEVYKKKLNEIRNGLILGNTLADEFAKAAVFPGLVERMIAVGEQSGRLTEQLAYLANEYRQRFNDVVDNLGEIIKPVSILVVGGIFIFILSALFLPIYQLIGTVGKSY
jgi:general secretion pathway protein F/type IV pilus assembly protein PilC